MTISYLGIFFGLLLLAVPVAIIKQCRLNILQRVLMSFFRMLLTSCVAGLLFFAAAKTDSIVVQCALAIVFCLYASLFTIRKSRVSAAGLLLPVAVGSSVAIVVVGFYTLFLILGVSKPFAPAAFIPVFGLISGTIVGADARAIYVYYSGLRNHGQLYYYLLGNGSTRKEAVAYFFRRSLQASAIHTTKQVASSCMITAPMIMWVALMAGTDILTAVAFQVILYIIIMCATLTAVFISLTLARRYGFDRYGRLKTTVSSEPSDSSANLSEPLHTDLESQPQES